MWAFVQGIVAAAETFPYDPGMSGEAARAMWFLPPPGRTVGSNRAGPGAHLATGSFMVDPAQAGHGVGRALGTAVLDRARAAGDRGVRFNAVVESNARAVGLWRSLGFEVLGHRPRGIPASHARLRGAPHHVPAARAGRGAPVRRHLL